MKLPRKGDNPAGSEVLSDLLRRQGYTVKRLSSALASMPLTKEGERAPAVPIDVEQTSLDEDTRDHLVEWVDAGGVLVLAGEPYEWPKAFGAAGAFTGGAHAVTARQRLSVAADENEDNDEDDGGEAVYARTLREGRDRVGRGARLQRVDRARRLVRRRDDLRRRCSPHGAGYVLGIADDELMTNAGLALPGNAAVMVSILSSADRHELRLADVDDGVSPPTTPIAALLARGLRDGPRPRGRRRAWSSSSPWACACPGPALRRRRAAAPSPSTSRPWAPSTAGRATRPTR